MVADRLPVASTWTEQLVGVADHQKNIPDELLDRLREVAERERRSITQQVLYMLEQALTPEGGTTNSAQGTDDELEEEERP